MTLDEDIRKFGAKGAVLKYIHDTDPSIPIEPFVLVPVGVDWRDYNEQILELGDCLVRSSSPLEDGKRVSFAGLFYTTEFTGERSVNDVLDSVSDEDVLDYAKIHGIKGPIEMGLVFQRDSKSNNNWGILRHPHMPELLFIMGTPIPNPYRFSDNYVYNESTGKLQDVHDYSLSYAFGERPKELPDYLAESIDVYKKIEAMPEFQTGYTYHMEFGTLPFSVYQFRPFRKKENADWNLDSIDFSDDVWNDSSLICFGITPPEGLELTLARALSTHEIAQGKFIDYYRSELSDLPHDEIVQKLMERWPLSEQERVYAEQVARIDPNTFGANESEAFDTALSELNKRANKKETCLSQEAMHFYYGRGADLVFPNAKVWIPEGGQQFLSHDWFRSMQHYDIVLVGLSPHSKTGDKVRVYSDGVKGKVVPL